MDKLELAIRKTADEGQLYSSFQKQGSSCMDDIAKMETSSVLDHQQLLKKKIIFPGFKDIKLINAFRELRTSITGEASNNLILVTSICAKSGTSFFARNLAAAISFDASKTSLLVDCNLNGRSEVGELFEVNDKPGVSDFITNKDLVVENIIHDSGVKRFRVIPFGQCDGGFDEYYSHPRFHQLLDQIKNRYQERKVILDAPPILGSADTRILMALCDQVVLVVPYGKGSKAQLENAVSTIGKEKLAGIVFNNFVK